MISEWWSKRRAGQLHREHPDAEPTELVDARLDRLIDRLRALDVRVEKLEEWREDYPKEDHDHG